MVEIKDIQDEESLGSWLREQDSYKVSVTIAARAALRVMPLIWGTTPNALMRQTDLLPHHSPQFFQLVRMCVISVAAARTQTDGIVDRVRATETVDPETLLNSSVSSKALEAAYSMLMSAEAVNANWQHTVDAVEAAAGANSQVPRSEVFAEVRKDCERIADQQDPWLSPLLDESSEIRKEVWPTVSRNWRQQGAPWDFFAEWYQGLLNGEQPDWPLLEEIALLEPKLWEGEAAPARVADRIKQFQQHQAEAAERLSIGVVERLEKRLKQLEERNSALFATLQETASNAQGQEKRLSEQSGRIKQEISELLDRNQELASKYKTLQEEVTERINAAVKSVVAERQLQRLVTHWEIEVAAHQSKATWAFWIFFVGLLVTAGAIIGAGSLILANPDLIDQLTIPQRCLDALNDGSPSPCPRFSFQGILASAGIVTLLTLMLWFVRLKMKEFLAERHLMVDAQERKVFAETFIELLAVPELQDIIKGHSDVILHAMFRHGSDGIITEEGGLDPSALSLLSRSLAR